MLRKLFIFCFILFTAVCLQAGEMPAAVTGQPQSDTSAQGPVYEYLIDAGDILEISVWGYDELTRDVIVRPDGKISYILVGDIAAKNQTPVSLAASIQARISEYVKKPKVTIILKKTGDKKVFLLGSVRAPGSYAHMQGEGLLEALSEAGGLTREASPGEVKIFRKNTSGIELVDFEDLLSADTQSRNVQLQPGDVVYVPELTKSRGEFIFGEHPQPGLYDERRAPTLLALIACAGGLKASASPSSIRVVRGDVNPKTIHANFDRALSRPGPKEDIALLSGDIVYVPRSVLGNVTTFASQILPPLQVIYYLNYIIKEVMDLP